jgi:hypothetical protein
MSSPVARSAQVVKPGVASTVTSIRVPLALLGEGKERWSMPRSNYSKIFDLLTELAKEDAPKELFALAEEIRDKKIESFAIWRPALAGAPPEKTYCSTKSIRRLIRFVRDLGLLRIGDSAQCTLSSYGRRALEGDDYATTLATHVAMYLNENAGITYTEIKDIIASIRGPDLPFFHTIYERIAEQRDLRITESRLRMVLYLLERCGMLTTLTRKVYFAPESEAWHT